MKHPPIHIRDKEEYMKYEPLLHSEDNILEETLRREAERVAHQENVMKRVVYDCVEPNPHNPVNIKVTR